MFLQSGYLIVQGQVVDERVALWDCRLCMFDAGQNVERVHIVYELHSELVVGRHGLAASLVF